MKKAIYIVIILIIMFVSPGCSGKKESTSGTITSGDQVTEDVQDTEMKDGEATGKEQETGGTLKESSTSGSVTSDDVTEKAVSSKQDTIETKSQTTETKITRTLEEGEEGEITYLEGRVGITRNAVAIDPADIDTGTTLQNYDLITTRERSMAEIEVLSKRCPGMLITVSENTSFSFDINKIEGKENTNMGIFAGSIALKVDALTKDQELSVNTGETAMGVRGTSFSVTTLASGDVLVTCKEGSVECKDNTGKRAYAKPGKVIEGESGSAIKEVNVPVSKVDSYEETWFDKKVELLKGNALEQIQKNASQYEKRLSQFNEAYDALFSEKAIIDKWKQEDTKGTIGSNMEVMREKKKIIGHLYDIQKTLFWFERSYYRLIELKKFHDEGFGKGNIREGLTTDAFFNNLVKQNLDKKLADIRYIHKLYARRNEGSVPIGSVSESFDDDDFFGDDDDFFGDDDF